MGLTNDHTFRRCAFWFVVAAASGQLVLPSADVNDVYYPALNWSDNFDWKLLKEVALENRNVLISPICLKIVLALLFEGSSGSTEREFQTVLQFGNKKEVRDQYRQALESLQVSEKNEYVLNMGTRIFLHSEIQPKQKYASVAKDDFKADIEQTNFSDTSSSSQAINSWVEKLTNGRISKLVKADDLNSTVMILANAVFFRGTWRNRFPKNQTFIGKFYVPFDNNFLSINVPFMNTEAEFYYIESPSLDAKILRMPYKGDRYSMFIVLPNSKGGLPSLLRNIHLHNLKNLLYLMDKRMVNVTLPKFKFDYQARLTSTLQKFGLIQMFQNTASFPGIARGNNTLLRMLVVSDVIQKSGIELDEEGSVVYAATEANIISRFGVENGDFKATHPFAFFILDEMNGNVLFAGKLEHPLEEASDEVSVT
ncbi:hypothetical protein NQ317_001154 [Molorchus minor]|uniref:Serpin domain-containing protein n=1 Tax=Molorchus minor TaxID=1323400 RepID=A0ABQ9JE49_9CUCU|nr:hypothetical protein NQ317_001154 [Molorchus minor]